MHHALDPSKSKVDGLAFLGLSLARRSDLGHPDSDTHQTAFDLNDVLDRDYEYVFSTNDDGWLVGGGEPGPPNSYKLAAKDSAHVEIMRIGTYRREWGGIPLEELLEVMTSGEILIPQVEVVPTAVVANPDTPPEIEIRFDMDEPNVITNFDDLTAPLPVNWQLRFIHNQLFKKFIFPSRFCPGAFHSTILRKAEFRSEEHRARYFAKCDAAVRAWRERGPQPLNTVPRGLDGTPLPAVDVDADVEDVAKDETVVASEAESSPPTSEPAASDVPAQTGGDAAVVEEPLVTVKVRVEEYEAANDAAATADALAIASSAVAQAMAGQVEEESPPSEEELRAVATTTKDSGSHADDEAAEEKKEEDEFSTYSSRPPPLDDFESPLAPPPQSLPNLNSWLHGMDNSNDENGDLSPEDFVAKAFTNLEVTLDVPEDEVHKTVQEADRDGDDEPGEIPLRSPSMATATTNLEVCLEDTDAVVQKDEEHETVAVAAIGEGVHVATIEGSTEKTEDLPKEDSVLEPTEVADQTPQDNKESEAVGTIENDVAIQAVAVGELGAVPMELEVAGADVPNDTASLPTTPLETPLPIEKVAETDVAVDINEDLNLECAEHQEQTPDEVGRETEPEGVAGTGSFISTDAKDGASVEVGLVEAVSRELDTVAPPECHSGIWLFVDRENLTHFFKPNFLPPYDTPEKKRIILDVLREEWDEKTLSWKPCGEGSMTKAYDAIAGTTQEGSAKPKKFLGDVPHLQQLDEFMGGFLSSMDGLCSPQTTSHKVMTTK